MKKLYSFLLLTLVAALGITAAAKEVTLEFSNPAAIDLVVGNYGYGVPITDIGKTMPWNTDIGSPYVKLKDGCSIVSVTCNGASIDFYEAYYPDGAYQISIEYDSNVGDGDTVLITTEGGEAAAGPEGDYIAFVRVSDPDAITVDLDAGSFGFYAEQETIDGGIVVRVKPDFSFALEYGWEFPFYIYSNGPEIESVTLNGSPVPDDDSLYYIGGVTGTSKAEVVVTLPVVSDSWTYTIKCSTGDDLSFSRDDYDNISISNYNYSSGSYTVTLRRGATGSVVIQNLSYYSMLSATTAGGQTLTPNQYNEIEIPVAEFPSDETFTVNFGSYYTIVSPADMLQFSGSDVDSSYEDGVYKVSFSGTSLQMSVKDEYAAQTYKLASLSCTNITMGTGSSVSASNGVATLNVSPTAKSGYNYKAVFTFDMTLTGPDGLTVKFGSSKTATYDNGTYTLSNVSSSFGSNVTAVSAVDALAVTGIEYKNHVYAAVDGTATVPSSDLDMMVRTFAIETGAGTAPTTFTWTFTGAEGLSVTYNNQEAEYAGGKYTITRNIEGWENYYTVEVGSASETLQVVSVTKGDDTFERVGNQAFVVVPTTALAAENLSFTINTRVVTPEVTGVTFVVDDATHIGSVWNVMRSKSFEFTDNTLKYTDVDDLVFYPASNSSIVKITAGSFEGAAVATQDIQGGKMVAVSSLTQGESYYITTTGPGATDDLTAYTFECPEGDVLEFSGISGITAVYADGKYTVKPIVAATPYVYLTVNVKDAFASQYTLSSVTSGSNKFEPQGGAGISIPVYYLAPPMTFTVTFNAKYNGFQFNGADGFYADYAYQNFDWDNGSVKVPQSVIQANYGSVVLRIAGGFDLELVNVTDESGQEYTPSDGTVTIPTAAYSAFGFQQVFTVTTQKPEGGQEISFTAELMNGNSWDATLYVGNQSYDFYDNPRTVRAGVNQTIQISANSKPYEVKVDGVVLGDDLWDYSFGDMGFFTIEPGSDYYPQDNGRIEIYMVSPQAPKYNVSFSFANEGTSGFVQQIGIQNPGQGLIYYSAGESVYDNAIANGLLLDEGSGLSLVYNTTDYTVNSVTVNGAEQAIGGEVLNYTNDNVDGNLQFAFDVDMVKGNTVTFSVTTSYYQQVYIIDRNYAGESDMDKWITLNAASTEMEFSPSTTELKITAMEGYEIPSSDNGQAGIHLTYLDGTDEYVNAGTYFEVVDGMGVEITVNKQLSANERVLKFYSEADVLYFDYPDPSNGYALTEVAAPWTAPTANAMGFYTLTNFTESSLYMNVNEDARDEYKIDYIEYVEQNNYRIASSTGYSLSLPMTQITGNATFNVVFKQEVDPRIVTIEVSNPSCVSRIYNSNVTMTSFPYDYDLNDGATLTVALRDNCTLNSVTCNGRVINNGMTIDLSGVEEGDVVTVDVTPDKGDYAYTFNGAEGLKVVFNGIQAPFTDGQYIVSNVYAASKNSYNLSISVEPAFANKLCLVNVTDGDELTWTTTGASQEINIPGSQLPAKDATFVITTAVPDPSETTRVITLTIDDLSVVSDAYYNSAAGRFSFDADGKVSLTVTPTDFEVTVITTKAVNAITTDVEGTFTAPALPATQLILNLRNVVDGQTINLITDESGGVSDALIDENGPTVIYNLSGVRVKPENLTPGFYIVNGKKMHLK